MKKRIFSLALASTLVLGSASALAAESSKLVENVPFINGYEVQGQELNEFRPENDVKRAEIAKIVSVAFKIAEADTTFTDVDKAHWGAKFIGGIQAAKVTEGYPDGTFHPEASLTRAEFSAMVARVLGDNAKEVAEAKDYSDVKDHWAKDAIEKVTKAGIVVGYPNGSFKPDKNITRAEAVKMVLGALGRNIDPAINSKVENPFSDVKEGAWYLNDVLGAATTYDYKTGEDGKEEIAVAVDTKVISSVEVPKQAFESDAKDKSVEIRVNGSTEAYDLNQAKANGYEVKFYQLDKNGDVMTANDEDYILADGNSTDGKLTNEAKKIGDYTIEVRVLKDKAIVARAKGTVTIVDKMAEKTEAIKSVEMKTANGIKVANNTIVVGEEANISKLIADVDGKKDVDVVADGIDYQLKSSDDAVVSVDKDTKAITGETVGKATLTVKLGKATKEIEVTVAKDERKATSIEKVEEVKLVKGREKTIKVKILDQYGAEVKDLTIGTENSDKVQLLYDENKITVTQDKTDKSLLKVQANGSDLKDSYTGNVYLSVKDDDNKPVQLGSFKVSVGDQVGDTTYKIEAEPGKDLKLDLSKEDDKSVKLNLVGYDKDGKQVSSEALSGNVVVSDTEVASFEDGVLTGNKAGKVTVTAQAGGKACSVEVEVVAESYKITKVTFNSPALNVAKTYELGDFLSKENIENNVNSTSDVKAKKEGEKYNLYVNEDKIGSIEVYADNLLKDITLVDDMDKAEIAKAEPGGKATVRISIKDNDGNEIAFKLFNIDVK